MLEDVLYRDEIYQNIWGEMLSQLSFDNSHFLLNVIFLITFFHTKFWLLFFSSLNFSQILVPSLPNELPIPPLVNIDKSKNPNRKLHKYHGGCFMFYFVPTLPEYENCFGVWFYSITPLEKTELLLLAVSISKSFLVQGGPLSPLFHTVLLFCLTRTSTYCASDTGYLSPYVLSPHVSEK